MLKVPPPTRVALGTLQIGGQKVELFLSPEWARYFESLNSQVQSHASIAAQSAALTAFLGEGAEMPDVLPGPPGQAGQQGESGLPLFLLQDEPSEQEMFVPPSVDGVYIPLKSKDATDGVPGLTQFKLNLKNAAGTITSWITTAASAVRTWTMPNKSGTVALIEDFAAPPAIGNTTAAAAGFTTVSMTDNLTITKTGAPPKVQLVAGTGTNAAWTEVNNTGGTTYFGVNDSAGSTFGGTAYAAVIFTGAGRVIQQIVAGTGVISTTSAAGVSIAKGFGCNGKAPQVAAASGGTLAGVIAALVANGILSS